MKSGERSLAGAMALVLVAILAAGATAPAKASEFISRQAWPRIQRGIQVTQYAKLAGIVDKFDRKPGSRIVILYPGGETGHDWATTVRNWFVALGVPSRMIAMKPGSGRPDSLALDVEGPGPD